MFISFLLALTGCLVTGVQTVLIYLQGEGVCFNDGCRIVDSLTLVDPLYFNLAGFLFFLTALIGIGNARRGSDLWRRFISIVLLAALAAEGVLFSFQIIISEAFCSYCLIILALIALMNMFMGLKQFFKALIIFSSVLLASFALDYHGGSMKPHPLENGTMGRLASDKPDREVFLFVSSSCEHCKKIIAYLGENRICTVNFNPIDRVDSIPLEGVERTATYDPKENVAFLKRLGINQIPVLVSKTESAMTILQGEQAIQAYIDEHCRTGSYLGTTSAEGQSAAPMTSSYQAAPLLGDDGCTIDENCDDTQLGTPEQSSISIQ